MATGRKEKDMKVWDKMDRSSSSGSRANVSKKLERDIEGSKKVEISNRKNKKRKKNIPDVNAENSD